jgi:hypothetical protein
MNLKSIVLVAVWGNGEVEDGLKVSGSTPSEKGERFVITWLHAVAHGCA